MSKITYFPHPVLATYLNDDYNEDCDFKIIHGERHENEEREIIIDDIFYDLKSKTLKKLLENNYAKVVCEVRCAATLFSEAFEIEKKPKKITLKQNELRGTIEFDLKIVLSNKLSNFIFDDDTNRTFYEGESFDLLKNDILAISDTKKFTFEPRNLPDAEIQAKEIFRCVPKSDIDQIEYNIDKEGVFIYLPDKSSNNIHLEWQNLSSKKNLRNLLFVFPLVIRVINRVLNDEISYKWTETIQRDINKYDLVKDNHKAIFKAAQKIMNKNNKASYLKAVKEALNK
ncbi:MAG: hypothetical protein HON33_07905 [Flavobacteriaceae bacterium]|jgi:hypothetical protein|nr:hypothetical protein [Flavobacteriaceae bacterium]MBT6170941.1 hypothetical protein [Flavobacteriaceae bacterium]